MGPTGGKVRVEVEGDGELATGDRILTVPNVLSVLRLASVPVFVWLFLNDQENAAVIIYGVAASSDFLDGWIARRFNQVSEVGKLLDPLADRIFIVALAIALVGRGTLPWPLAVAIIGRDLLLLAAYPLLFKRVGPIPVNFTGKTATAFLLIGLTCLALSETTLPLNEISNGVGMAFTIAGAVLYWVAGGMYAREAMLKLKAVEDGAVT